jgi:hypothetical protein
MPLNLSAVLAGLAVEAGPSEFAAVKNLLRGTFSGLADVRRKPAARIDAADLTPQEIKDWLSGLPIAQQAELRVAWIADRLGARMSFEMFAANVDSLWFPAMDDIVAVLASDGDIVVLVLDHEELITLSGVDSGQHCGRPWSS